MNEKRCIVFVLLVGLVGAAMPGATPARVALSAGPAQPASGVVEQGKVGRPVHSGSRSGFLPSAGLSPIPDWTAESDQASAEFGNSVSTAGDVNGDGYVDVIVGARYYDNGQGDEGAAFVYYGSAAGLDIAANWVAESDQAGSHFGWSVGPAGDVNGDGYDDVIVGAVHYHNGQTNEGRAYVFHGSARGLSLAPDWTAESDQAQARLAGWVSTAGDVNGDGYDDVIVGAIFYSNGQSREGRAFVYHGSAAGLSAVPDWTAESDQNDAFFGSSARTAGDVNGDGYDDVIVGARQYDNGETDEGRAYVFHGSATGLSLTPDWTAESDQAGALFGHLLGTAGDVNGDGYDDVIVGATYYDNGQVDEGRAYLFYGSAGGLQSAPSWMAEGDQVGANFGRSLSTVRDINGDGYADVIVGAHYYDNGQTDEGAAYVFHGSATGLSLTPDWTAESDQAGAEFGYVGTAGDVNGDGYSDVVIGASEYDNGQTNEGTTFVYHGSAALPPCEPHSYLETTQGDWMRGEHSTVDVRSLDALGTPYGYDDDPRGGVRLRSRPGTWTKYAGNPVLQPDPEDTWGPDGTTGPKVILRDGFYEMWYGGTEVIGEIIYHKIGYATSPDGIVWTKYGGNPVLEPGPPGTWDDGSVTQGRVLYDGTEFRVWYQGRSANWAIGYATSPDGLDWTKYEDNPILEPGPPGSWDSYWVSNAPVIFDGSGYQLWYMGRESSGHFRIGYATSPDGLTWTKYEDNPVLAQGPAGSWDERAVARAAVLYDGTEFKLWYSGRDDPGTWRIGYATSPNGINWTKSPGNPVLDVGTPGEWDDNTASIPVILFDGAAYRMWYAGNQVTGYGRIGYAEAVPQYDAEGSYTSSLVESGVGAGQQLAWQWLWIQQQLNGQMISYDLLDEAGNPIPGFTGLTVPDGGGGLDISALPPEYSAIYLRANLSTADPAVSPVLEQWEVQWCLQDEGELPPTSLEVEITLDGIMLDGDSVAITGTISAQNDVENPAYINWVRYGLEYRIRREWIPFQEGDVAGPSTVEPGGLAVWPYQVTFVLVPGAKAYRIVGYVELENHPGGPHVFLARQSFNPPVPGRDCYRVWLPFGLEKATP